MPGTPPAPETESIGAVLTRVRIARGMSQLRLAELLCAAAASPTLTRHEISRWEREDRIPSAHWLRWLGAVLDVTLDELERAADAARDRRADSSTVDSPLWMEEIGADLLRLAYAWLAGNLGPGTLPPHRPRRGRLSLPALGARLDQLRRMDDLVGSGALAPLVGRELRAALAQLSTTGREARAAMRLVAEFAQLAGWVFADAARPAPARKSYRIGLRLAAAAGDRTLAAHVLASASHTLAGTEALPLARTACAGARPTAPAGAQALLLHRVAHAAALGGERRTCERALAAADRAAGCRDAARDPRWLYWLDDTELEAMTGRTFAALGRPRSAEPLLGPRVAQARTPARTAAFDGGWLARAHVDAGEGAAACVVAGDALVAAIRAGSARAARHALSAAPALLRLGPLPEARVYAELLAAAGPLLPFRGAVTAHRPGTG